MKKGKKVLAWSLAALVWIAIMLPTMMHFEKTGGSELFNNGPLFIAVFAFVGILMFIVYRGVALLNAKNKGSWGKF